jgi:hypothetical protein
MAVTVFEDLFTEAGADVNLASHTPNTGTNWTEVEDTYSGGSFLEVESTTDDLRPDAGATNVRLVYRCNPTIALTGPDYDIEFVYSALGSNEPNGVIARWQDTSNTYFAEVWINGPSGYTMAIYKKVAGTVTLLDSDNTAVAATNVFLFQLRGSTLKLFQDGVERCSVSDSAITTTGVAGVYWGNLAGIVGGDSSANNRMTSFKLVDQNTSGGNRRRRVLMAA